MPRDPRMPRFTTRSYGSKWFVDDAHRRPFENRTITTVGDADPPLTEAEAEAIAAALNDLHERED